MCKKALTYMQYLLPKQLISILMGCLAASRISWLKNYLIQRFIKTYDVDMSIAKVENPSDYVNFNSFFIRQLKPELRPIANAQNAIASPVDGTLAQKGNINRNQLLQVKNFYFDLETLLGNDSALAQQFYNGTFATLYLAPQDYHRVHMPVDGSLEKTLYVPGKLFSVNRMTSEIIPNLYSRNERLISLFNTEAGPMAVILVGAMIVGSIQTVWTKKPVRSSKIYTETFSNTVHLNKGDELGHFELGSTVILLFSNQRAEWAPSVGVDAKVQFGQLLGNFMKIPAQH